MVAAALSLPPTLHTNAMCDHHNLSDEVDDDGDGDDDDDGVVGDFTFIQWQSLKSGYAAWRRTKRCR